MGTLRKQLLCASESSVAGWELDGTCASTVLLSQRCCGTSDPSRPAQNQRAVFYL